MLVGRSSQMQKLDEILLGEDRRSRVVVLTGTAGVGKTALAVEWARRAGEAFPDGTLYINAQGFGPAAALEPREILADFLRSLGQSRAAERGSLEERSASFRTSAANREMLIVVDNAVSVAQVRPLLPGTVSCAVLVTSREQLRGLAVQHSAEVIEVEPLTVQDSLTLLRTATGGRVAADPDHAAILARRCANLPLALRIAAEMIKARRDRDLASFVAELDDADLALDLLDTGDDPHSAVRMVFSWSYQGLPTPIAEAFGLLCLHPGNSFSLPVAAALLGSPPSDARNALRSLTNAHLVTQPSPGRFQIHDLLRVYGRQLYTHIKGPESRSSALRRMFDHYLYSADSAGRIIMPHRYRFPLDDASVVAQDFNNRDSAMEWFDLERHNLVELFRIPGDDFDQHSWRLAYTLRDYFFVSKYLDGWIETHTLAVAACERLGDRRAQGITRNNLGRALLEAGETQEAAAQYRLAYSLLSEAGDTHGVTDSMVNLASVLRRQGAHSEALRSLQEAVGYYRRHGMDRKVGITLRSIARTELALGQLTEAAQHGNEAFDCFVELNLDLDVAQALNTLGMIHHRAGDGERAERLCREAITHSRKAGSPYEEASAWHLLGRIAADCGDTDSAKQRWANALSIYQGIGAGAALTVATDLRLLGRRA
jgi:tetratricopeptide (TPR) repeat protein